MTSTAYPGHGDADEDPTLTADQPAQSEDANREDRDSDRTSDGDEGTAGNDSENESA